MERKGRVEERLPTRREMLALSTKLYIVRNNLALLKLSFLKFKTKVEGL